MELSVDERNFLLSVAEAEQEEKWDRFDDTIGLVWDVYSLLDMNDPSKPQESDSGVVQIPRKIRIPLLMALAPEFFKHLTEEYKKKYESMLKGREDMGGAQVMEIGNLSTQAARDLFKNIGNIAAAVPNPEGK